ncbi:hypothetical protein HNE05_18175 [Aquipseudomonas campi]|uniref:Uncharacterized protein n=1 Tax=Aquipseudomonas campi TaxID=2731681 RepID=A0A6M8FD09_9GAMM|nr:hypothetical protein [Pseudomonas campi]QKE65201.1 hypothetical protein HNE05_18175 [Pseudomonas campi]
MPQPLLSLLLSICLALFCNPASANRTDAAPAHLHQLRLAVLGSLGDFYLLYGIDADPAHSRSLERRMALADVQLALLAESSDVSAIRQPWHSYANLLGELNRRLQQQEDPDGSAIAELIRLNGQLMTQCDALANRLDQPPLPIPDDLTQRGRNLELLLQQITTHYIAYNVGANSLGGDLPAIDQLTEEFDGALKTLLPATPQSHEYQRLLGEIDSKWRYIEPSLRNYQSSAIPSLVNRYGARIIEAIARLPLARAESGASVSR